MTEEQKNILRQIKSRELENISFIDELLNYQEVELLDAVLEGNTITVSFRANKNIDIHYWYDEKVHSVEKYGHDIKEEIGEFRIGVNEPEKDWKVQIIAEDYASKPLTVKKDEGEQEPDEKPEPKPTPKALPDFMKIAGDKIGWITGVVKNRIYFENREIGKTQFVEWNDGFSKPFTLAYKSMYVFYHNGWKGYSPDGHEMVLYTSEDGITFDRVGIAFEWKNDTSFSCHWDGTKYRMFGRVRGGLENGGFDNPKPDRRGISYHANPTWDGDWEKNRILADPMDFWDYDKKMKPDFYTGAVNADNVGYPSIFWRNDDNVITKPDGSTRISGDLYPIKVKYNSPNIEIVSKESVIDLSNFDVIGQNYAHSDLFMGTHLVYTHVDAQHYYPSTKREIYIEKI